jgi:hypothetical protein
MFTHNMNGCQWSVEGIQELDACDDVLVVIAHDGGILPVIQQAHGKGSSFVFLEGNLNG